MDYIIKILRNKIFLYLSSRYIIYAFQFVGMILVSTSLGPYNYGRWGFILLMFNYFTIFNWGIPSSVNVLLVQNKNDVEKEKEYISSALVALLTLVGIVLLVAIFYSIKPLSIFEKYDIGVFFYIICVTAIINYFNDVFGKIYRIKNKLLELSLNQSLFPTYIVLIVFVFSGETLFNALLFGYCILSVVCLLIYVGRKAISFGGKPRKEFVSSILTKGFFLFLYNSCFYLILTTTSTIISIFYSVEDYGYYMFSYSLGHSVLLILDALTFIAFPKIIDIFYRGTKEEIINTMGKIRINYVIFSHGLMYLAFAFFPIFMQMIPSYSKALPALCLTALGVLLNTNSFGYNTYLIAQNDEKYIAGVSFVSLVVNILICIFIANNKAPFYYVVFGMMISYLLFSLLCANRAMKMLNIKSNVIILLRSIFPLSILIPFLIGVYIVWGNYYEFSFIPFLLFVILNLGVVKNIFSTFKLLVTNPNYIDLR